ncbi:translation initiation factor IF-2-like [Elephas maximus indicus]|uniref:translation initiation factor IF-2-like n=1 Tax=Elephas maximus indicus TaxID=99487 RepID=UPI002116C838|nr:translation initiation factor IF-2-like [Elephas maximus indicus]
MRESGEKGVNLSNDFFSKRQSGESPRAPSSPRPPTRETQPAPTRKAGGPAPSARTPPPGLAGPAVIQRRHVRAPVRSLPPPAPCSPRLASTAGNVEREQRSPRPTAIGDAVPSGSRPGRPLWPWCWLPGGRDEQSRPRARTRQATDPDSGSRRVCEPLPGAPAQPGAAEARTSGRPRGSVDTSPRALRGGRRPPPPPTRPSGQGSAMSLGRPSPRRGRRQRPPRQPRPPLVRGRRSPRSLPGSSRQRRKNSSRELRAAGGSERESARREAPPAAGGGERPGRGRLRQGGAPPRVRGAPPRVRGRPLAGTAGRRGKAPSVRPPRAPRRHCSRRAARSHRTPSHVTTCAAADTSRPLPARICPPIKGLFCLRAATGVWKTNRISLD